LKFILLSKLALVALLGAALAQAQTLRGSPASIERQYQAARSYGLVFVDTARSVDRYVGPGRLVRVNPDRYMELHDVSYPYAVPATKLFLNRLSSQYYSACGEKLTVTSLLRPRDRQPVNSVAKSVHPTGMAVDLRVPGARKCRAWLENTLLALEGDRVLDVTRERHPSHYHVALFVKNYEQRLGIPSRPTQFAANSGPESEYRVRRGDTLSKIAATAGVSVSRLRAANGLHGNRIYVGQQLQIPGSGGWAANGEIKHKVIRGDTLWRIANLYGTSVAHLRRVNADAGDFLQVGQVLVITKG
jgi:LysM repeat protein